MDQYDHEWEPPRIHWLQNQKRFAYEQVDRGHQRLRVIAIDTASGEVSNLVDEKTGTFIWTVHTENLERQLYQLAGEQRRNDLRLGTGRLAAFVFG